jgi:hypothetical protein
MAKPQNAAAYFDTITIAHMAEELRAENGHAELCLAARSRGAVGWCAGYRLDDRSGRPSFGCLLRWRYLPQAAIEAETVAYLHPLV